MKTLLLLMLVAVGACDKMSSKQSQMTNAAATDTNGPIVVGHYASMTGSEATFGQSTENGIRLALEERNAKGGIRGRGVEVKTMDTQSKATEAGTVVTRLITSERVVALLGEVASTASLSGGRVAEQAGVPMISPSSTNATVTKEGTVKKMIFRVCFIDSFQGYVMAKFAVENLKINKVAVLYAQNQAYSFGLAKDFEVALTALGATIASKQTYTGGDSDMSAQLAAIKASGAQAIYLPGYYTDVGNIARQARKLGITVPFLGGDGWDSDKLTEIAGDALEGSYYSNHYSFEETRPEVGAFVEKYKAKFSAVPDGLAALGYDAANVLFDAMERAPSLGGTDLAAAIAATKNFAGVTGNITIDENHDAQKQAVVVQIKQGRPAWVASIAPPGATATQPPAPAAVPAPAAQPAPAPTT